ncbi:MAG: hypothetical protein HRT63_01480 [Erythrobacter sp.]|nr:hypothetical protein [Erythrobacter sp.]
MPLTSLRKAFTEHPESIGESYFEHLGHASSFGWRMVVGGCACFLHGLFPFLFVKTGSEQVSTLHTRMVTHRSKAARAQLRLSQDEGAPIDFVI